MYMYIYVHMCIYLHIYKCMIAHMYVFTKILQYEENVARLNSKFSFSSTGYLTKTKGACGVMVIIVEYGHGDTSSNPGRD